MDEPYAATGIEAEFELGSRGRVLRNLKGLRLVREIHEAELKSLLAAGDAWVSRTRSDHRFTAADIRAMHRDWLGEIYPWAGEYRTVDLSKGDLQFAKTRQVDRLMLELDRGPLTEHTPCRPGELRSVAHSLAVVHAELILIHPFREGNGRCARLLASLMALQAGLPGLRFDRFDGPGKASYFRAIRGAFDRDYESLSQLFASAIEQTVKRQRKADRR